LALGKEIFGECFFLCRELSVWLSAKKPVCQVFVNLFEKMSFFLLKKINVSALDVACSGRGRNARLGVQA
jgi:hypothetical protein